MVTYWYCTYWEQMAQGQNWLQSWSNIFWENILSYLPQKRLQIHAWVTSVSWLHLIALGHRLDSCSGRQWSTSPPTLFSHPPTRVHHFYTHVNLTKGIKLITFLWLLIWELSPCYTTKVPFRDNMGYSLQPAVSLLHSNSCGANPNPPPSIMQVDQKVEPGGLGMRLWLKSRGVLTQNLLALLADVGRGLATIRVQGCTRELTHVVVPFGRQWPVGTFCDGEGWLFPAYVPCLTL